MNEVQATIAYHTEKAREYWRLLALNTGEGWEWERREWRRRVEHHEERLHVLMNLDMNEITELPDGYQKA